MIKLVIEIIRTLWANNTEKKMTLQDLHENILPSICWTSSKTGKPRDLDPSGLVMHHISAGGRWPINKDDPYNLDDIINKILVAESKKGNRISYNILIDRDATPHLLVPLTHQSFHAGYSVMNGRRFCNGFTFGMAIVSTGREETIRGEKVPAYEPAQIAMAAQVSGLLMDIYRFTEHWIRGHDHVRAEWNRLNPGNPKHAKVDPYDFPWDDYFKLIP